MLLIAVEKIQTLQEPIFLLNPDSSNATLTVQTVTRRKVDEYRRRNLRCSEFPSRSA